MTWGRGSRSGPCTWILHSGFFAVFIMSRTAALPPAALQTDRGGFRPRQLSGFWGMSPLSRGKQWPPGLALAFVHASNSSARLHSLKCPDSHTGEESSARTSMSMGGQGTARRSGKFGSFLAAGSFGLRFVIEHIATAQRPVPAFS
jgi:hypothetical protein